jgi:hypothetical protein
MSRRQIAIVVSATMDGIWIERENETETEIDNGTATVTGGTVRVIMKATAIETETGIEIVTVKEIRSATGIVNENATENESAPPESGLLTMLQLLVPALLQRNALEPNELTP